MDIQKQEKIKKFLSDKAMSQAVKEVLINSFLKTRGVMEVNFLAASRIAIDLLDLGFKDLERISKSAENNEDTPIKQVGL